VPIITLGLLRTSDGKRETNISRRYSINHNDILLCRQVVINIIIIIMYNASSHVSWMPLPHVVP
jgi:hypothetical protein